MKNNAYNYGTSLGTAAVHHHRAYASPGDFCAIFNRDMDSLYSLALVLTGSHETAQQCFLAALDDCRTGSVVFPEWARSWSRRAVIKNAIRLLDPTLRNAGVPEAGLEAIAEEMDISARPYLRLRPFDRFVFVISVLEGYRTRECAVLLGYSSRDVEQARVRALQQIGGDGPDLVPVPYVGGSRTEQIQC